MIIIQLEYGTEETTINVEPTNPKVNFEIEKLNNYAINNVERLSKTQTFDINEGSHYFKITIKSENRKYSEEYILKVRVLEGNDVTYYLDDNLLREDFHVYGENVLNPTNQVVEKTGQEFIGWKDNTEVDKNVIIQ